MRAILLAWMLLAAPAWGASSDDVDPLAIASRLVADGLFDRAAGILTEVERPADDDPDRSRFYTLRGMVRLNTGDPAGAALDLAIAVEDPETDPLLNLHLAQARLSSDDPEGALSALDAAGPAADEVPGAYLLRGKAAQALARTDEAWAALDAGRSRFPDHAGLGQQFLLLMVELGLHHTAAREAPVVFDNIGADATLWVTLGDALRRAGAITGARWVLEEARLRFPDSTDAKVALARACLDADLPRCAGEVLQEAAILDPVFASEAAECFRRAGAWNRALYANGLVIDPPTKLKQRLGLLLELQRFTEAAALEPRARRLELVDDQQVAYALAYAHFRTGDHERTETLLRGISDPDLFRQATALREAMERCRDGGDCG